MNMKKLIESMDRIEECGMTEMPAMAPPAPEMDKGNPVTVNVSMNASGKEHVADLLDMMKNAGLGDAAPAADAMMSPRMDMERLSGIMGEPADDAEDDKMNLPAIADLDGGEDESYANEMDDEEDDELAVGIEDPMDDEEEAETEDMSGEGTYTIKVKGKNMDSQNELARLAGLPTNEVDDEVEEAGGDYENEPDEQYSDLSAVIPDGDDLHKQKKSHPATAGGDNPMAIENIKAALYAALTEKKKTMVKGPDGKMVPDYAADGKGKGDLKKDTKTTEGRGKVMAGRGRGKDKLMAGRGRGKKK
jgi:hypothetical protein